MNKTKIREVDGISVSEIARAMKARKLYFAVGRRWNSMGGGCEETCYEVSTKRIRAYRPRANDFSNSSYGPVESPLTRAVFFNAGRLDADPAIQEAADKIRSLPVPECGEPAAVYVWHRRRGAISRCGH